MRKSLLNILDSNSMCKNLPTKDSYITTSSNDTTFMRKFLLNILDSSSMCKNLPTKDSYITTSSNNTTSIYENLLLSSAALVSIMDTLSEVNTTSICAWTALPVASVSSIVVSMHKTMFVIETSKLQWRF